MWYFTWILGVLLALAFGVINVMWYEAEECFNQQESLLKDSETQAAQAVEKKPNLLARMLLKFYKNN